MKEKMIKDLEELQVVAKSRELEIISLRKEINILKEQGQSPKSAKAIKKPIKDLGGSEEVREVGGV